MKSISDKVSRNKILSEICKKVTKPNNKIITLKGLRNQKDRQLHLPITIFYENIKPD